ncbi:MAG: ImmA/IrrE family metallo-endopeptidase [Maricaulis sp.]|uniref:ImmA/IrrE family metallo-endopeptidase n=1 Tax=Maricaulis sp. TaxID=1486257 RepID=UPI001B16BBAA|nr:ImmA/IrrE family metallo-endopeptidase [Maricaulis sp.]MBO6696911.1 ImmA/IrrE family metallo-endopeptidase [Henriciella sp.]MBO6730932.1 ImmA/IrrE family metallo-endopeptidase [Maricaulis sp.]MBO6878394.1 ImmA/IrrE family metallo-endopeptidase [Maricaulis sp.]
MTALVYRAPATSWSRIATAAWDLRVGFGLDATPFFPVMPFLEQVLSDKMELVELVVKPDEECGGAEGLTCPAGQMIVLPESTYRNATENVPRARFTVAHELGHLALHSNVQLARANPDAIIKPFENSETQADRYAAELLMPYQHFNPNETVETIAAKFGVSQEAARIRHNEWRKKQGPP